MKLLVTGATGFIGSAFCQAAIEAGYETAALIRPGRTTEGGAMDERILRISGDLGDPPFDAIARFNPEACVHAAWIATPGVYLESPENLDHQRWSFEFLSRLAAAGTKRLIVLGTCIEYALGPEPLSESATPLNPLTTYARCKHALHTSLREALLGTGATLAWARVFYPYGVGEHPARLCSSIIRDLRAGRGVTLKTPRSAKDYIHVTDVASALVRVLDSGFDGAINIGTGQATTILEIASRLAAKLGRSELVVPSAITSHAGVDRTVADNTRLRSLGWQPRVGLDEGLAQMLKHFSTHPVLA